MSEPILLWLDVETTGLDKGLDKVIELAWQFTDIRGNKLGSPKTYVMRPVKGTGDEGVMLDRVFHAHDAVKDMHRANGLFDELLFGETRTPGSVYYELAKDIELMKEEDGGEYPVVYIAGSSVHFDIQFMGYEYSPFQVSHRILDMSSIRTAAALQGINMYKFDAAGAVAHRALDDVERDIAQWVGYLAATTPDNGTVGKQ